MATQFSMIQIMNAALISQGFEEIVSTNDGSNECRLLSRNWPTIVEAELEAGLYSFARKQETLVSRIAGQFGFMDGYRVPNGALHVRRVWDLENPEELVDWVQDGTAVYVNSPDGITIEYAEAADPSLWTATFTLGVQYKLEAVLLRFKEEPNQAGRMEQMAELTLQKARTLSSKSRSAKEPFRASRFARARFGRG